MPLLDIFWSILMFFLMVAWIGAIIGVIGDVFRSKDLRGGAKALWVMFIIAVPWLGVLSYILLRGHGMAERNLQVMVEAQEAQRAYIQDAAGTSTADELTKLAELKANGVLSDAEFDQQKAKLLT